MKPTLAVLLKAPHPGRVKTRLAATVGEAEATAIYRRLVERQVRALPSSWNATIHFDPPGAGEEMRAWLSPLRSGLAYLPQSAGDLGARLNAAFVTHFSAGTRAVIALGGDCPGLDQTLLESAREKLLSADVVLGPAADGGYYLIGMNAPCAALFEGIPWSTPSTLARTREAVRRQGLRCVELPVLEDIDDAPSWERAGRYLLPQGRLPEEHPANSFP